MNEYLKDFVKSWLDKATAYDNSLPATFDKFFTYFVVYNALYNEAAARLIFRQEIKANQGTDKQSATVHAMNYIGADVLVQKLKEPACQSEIDKIVHLIKSGLFYIHSTSTGAADHAKDTSCINKITNGTNAEFCESVLTLIYKTRCNMFHGSKEYKHIQKDILEPMNIILKNTIDSLFLALGGAYTP